MPRKELMMNFSVLPPEVNSVLMHTGAGSGPMFAAATAWDGIGTELSSTAAAFNFVTTVLTADAWQGAASLLMKEAAEPYAGWLVAAAALAHAAGSQARAAADAFEAAYAAMVHPDLVTANRRQLVALLRSNLFGQNTTVIADIEAAHEQNVGSGRFSDGRVSRERVRSGLAVGIMGASSYKSP